MLYFLLAAACRNSFVRIEFCPVPDIFLRRLPRVAEWIGRIGYPWNSFRTVVMNLEISNMSRIMTQRPLKKNPRLLDLVTKSVLEPSDPRIR